MPPTSDFESFVRESLGEVRLSCKHMADALWDLIPRVDKVERVQIKHDRLLREHDTAIERHGRALDEHGAELEKRRDAAINVDGQRYDPERTPMGGIKLQPAIWDSVKRALDEQREAQAKSDATIRELQQSLAIEAARAAGAEEAQAKAEKKTAAMYKTIGVWMTGAALAAGGIAYAFAHLFH